VTQLRKMMLEELERRNYSQSTIRAYVKTIEDLARYFKRPPDQLGPDQLRQYQAYLFRERKLAPNTVIQRTAALRFFFVATLRRPWVIAETPYPRKTFRLPKILSPEQVSRLIEAAPTVFYRVLLMTLYATGLRRAELAHLQVSDIDSERMVIHVKGGKGRKDRDVMLSPKLLEELRGYIRGLRRKPERWLFPGNRWHTGPRLSAAKSFGKLAEKRPHEPDSEMRFTRTRCGTASPLICWNQEPTCARFNSCSAIAIWKRRHSTGIFPILACRPRPALLTS
jgi:integrase/recombinase XerD